MQTALELGIMPDAVLTEKVLYAHAKADDWEGAMSTFQRMHAIGVKLAPLTFKYAFTPRLLLLIASDQHASFAGLHCPVVLLVFLVSTLSNPSVCLFKPFVIIHFFHDGMVASNRLNLVQLCCYQADTLLWALHKCTMPHNSSACC